MTCNLKYMLEWDREKRERNRRKESESQRKRERQTTRGKERDQNIVRNLLRYHHRDKQIQLQYIVSNISLMKSSGAHVSTSCYLNPGLLISLFLILFLSFFVKTSSLSLFISSSYSGLWALNKQILYILTPPLTLSVHDSDTGCPDILSYFFLFDLRGGGRFYPPFFWVKTTVFV